MKKIFISIIVSLFFNIVSGQIGINTTLPSAALDVTSTTNGFLIPRVTLTANNVAAPVVNPAGGVLPVSTMIYNLANVTGLNAIASGYCYWNGTKWVSFMGSNSDNWGIKGNASTNDPVTPTIYGTTLIGGTENFAGTTDANDFVFGTNSIERMRIKQTTGNVGIGTDIPAQPLHVYKNSDSSKISVFGEALQISPGTDYNNIGVKGFARGATDFWGNSVGVMGVADQATSYFARGVYAGLGPTGFPFFITGGDTALFSDGNGLGYSALFTGGNVGIGNLFPDRARLQTQGAVGNTVATFNLNNNSLGLSIISDYPGIYFNSYFDGGMRQMSSANYNGLFSFDPALGQMNFAINTTPNTVAGNLVGGALFNRFIITRDFGATINYNNTTVTGLNVISGGIGTNLGFFSLGAVVATPGNGKGITAGGINVGIEARTFYTPGTIDRMPGLFYTSDGAGFPSAAAVGSVIDGIVYKIFGFGTVSTLIKDNQGKDRVLVAPEAPEALFQDYGIGSLVNGYAKINIDPILTKNIRVDESHPLKVFVQLEGECNGVYVFNKKAESFEVKELNNGISNVDFSYQIVANRADEERAGHLSKYSEMRFKLFNKELKIIDEKEELELNLVDKKSMNVLEKGSCETTNSIKDNRK